ncbi:phage tail tape measure protein [Myroides sp. JBRI-B21084]|uniref:phage tail tape measure protein n=1 Tax=Myroides sp. JBRI-B21084 TaxID=3119977 RepID=UPI0026E4005C|nr:phage tail tape measure protein [Paenimyroides cloacae]WKW47258.1 phage tail tape measure protein [Paenimyroides cloacae]
MGLAQINIRFKANLKEFSTEMQNVGREMEKIGSKMQSIGTAMSAAITLPLVAAGAKAYSMAADFEDALGATNQVFKSASKATQEWAQSLPSYYGIAQKEALEYSNMMGSMLKNIGNLTDQQASQQSAKLIQLAGDLTAMYGGTTADAVRALTGALKGNNTMLDNYGMAANDAMVKAKALEIGLITQGQEMSLAAKQAATLALVYEQSAAAQGQAAREANGASGSMRSLKTELSNLATELGQQLLPIITPIINGLRGMMERFRDLSPETKKIIVIVGGIAAALGPLIAIFGTFAAVLPSIIAGITAMGPAFAAMTGPIGLIIAGIGALIALIMYNWGEVKKTLADTANYWIDLYNESMLFRGAVQYIILVFKNLGNTIALVFNVAKSIVKAFWNDLKNAFGNLGNLLKAVLTGDFKSIPKIIGQQFKDSASGVKSLFKDLSKDFATFGAQGAADVNKAIENTIGGKRAKIKVDTQPTKKQIKTDIVTAVDEGVVTANNTDKKVKVKVEIEPVNGSIGYYDEMISELEKAQKNNATNNEMFKTFQAKIDEYKKIRDEISGNVQQEVVVGSESWYNQEIEGINKLVQNLVVGTDAYNALIKQREVLQNSLDLSKQTTETTTAEPATDTVDWYKLQIDKLQQAREEAGITIDEYKRISAEINVLETTLKIQTEGIEGIQQITTEINNMKTMAEASQQAISSAFGSMADAIGDKLGESKNILDVFGKALFQNTIKAIGTALAQSTSNAILAATGDASKIPFGTFLLPALIGGAVASVSSAFAAIPKFADGGIVSGPTFGMMGEYVGAANNPEVIAPLNKLKKLIQPAATNDQPVNVVLQGGFDLSGENLKLVLDRVERRKYRTG